MEQLLCVFAQESPDDIFYTCDLLELHFRIEQIQEYIEFAVEDTVRIGAINLVVALNLVEAIDLLLRVAQSNEELLIRKHAIWALVKLRTLDILKKLKDLEQREIHTEIKAYLREILTNIKAEVSVKKKR